MRPTRITAWALVCPECDHVVQLLTEKPEQPGVNRYCLEHEDEPGRATRPLLGLAQIEVSWTKIVPLVGKDRIVVDEDDD